MVAPSTVQAIWNFPKVHAANLVVFPVFAWVDWRSVVMISLSSLVTSSRQEETKGMELTNRQCAVCLCLCPRLDPTLEHAASEAKTRHLFGSLVRSVFTIHLHICTFEVCTHCCIVGLRHGDTSTTSGNKEHEDTGVPHSHSSVFRTVDD